MGYHSLLSQNLRNDADYQYLLTTRISCRLVREQVLVVVKF